MARRFLNRLLRFGYWLFLHLRVEGLERVPAKGPVILMINHTHFLDPFVVVASMPREVTAMSKIENFSIPFWGWVFKMYGAIPVRRGQVDRKALKEALAVLKTKDALLVAPEGTRSPNGALQTAHNGLSFIAHRSGAVIVPVAITGATRFGHHLKRLRRTPVQIKLGKPFRLRSDTRRLERNALNTMTTEAMYQLAALLPPDYRGRYSDLSRATDNYIHFLDEGAQSPKSRHEAQQPASPLLVGESEGEAAEV